MFTAANCTCGLLRSMTRPSDSGPRFREELLRELGDLDRQIAKLRATIRRQSVVQLSTNISHSRRSIRETP
jgi:hypothetical protein